MREPHLGFNKDCEHQRITPACAGTTESVPYESSHSQDHPRVCGNHRLRLALYSFASGSPPRVREPLRLQFVQILNFGITPACAGTTAHTSSIRTTARDHPRVCGNHCNRVSAYAFTSGSPPRVREPLYSSPSASRSLRITPACAGTTRQPDLLYRLDEDHPRVCGNHQ